MARATVVPSRGSPGLTWRSSGTHQPLTGRRIDYDAQHPSDRQITGETVARAKRTDRAEARRRYRAEMADADGVEEGVEGESPSGAAPTRPATKQMSSPPGRIGIGRGLPPVDPPDQRPRGPHGPAEARDRQGAVRPGRHHGRGDGTGPGDRRDELRRPPSCTPTSSSRRRSAGSSSPASWRRVPAGCSASSSGSSRPSATR